MPIAGTPFNYTKNTPQSTLASGYTAGNTTITVQTGDGAKFDSLCVVAVGTPPQFYLLVTGISGDTLSVGTSGYDGSTAVSVTSSTPITQVISAGVLAAMLSNAGGLVLLEEHTASNSASLSFTAWESSQFDEYLIEFVGLQPITNNVNFLLNWSTNGGSSYDTTAIYDYGEAYVYNVGGSAGNSGAGSQTAELFGGNISNTANYTYNGSMKFFSPASALYKLYIGQAAFFNNSTNNVLMQTMYGVYRNTAAVNAFQITFSSGNIAIGTVRVYGLSK